MRQPFPYQKDGIEFLKSADGHLLASDTGTGKTLMALHSIRDAKSVLVVCPSILTGNWVRECNMDLPDWHAVQARHKKDLMEARMVTVSIDNLSRSAWMYDRKWDVVIVDEAHMAANPEAKRTQKLYSQKLKTNKIVQLTATPTPRHAGQLWTHINSTAPERIDRMTYAQFTDRYCIKKLKTFGGGRRRTTVEVIDGNNAQRIPELRERLSGWWKRFRKADVLSQLPPKTVSTIYLPARKADINAIRDEMDPEVFEHMEWALEIAAQTGDLRELELVEDQVSRLRRLIAKVKAKPAAEYIQSLLDGGEQSVAVWGWHRDGMDAVEAALGEYGVLRIDGSTPARERDAAIEAFQSGKGRVFLGQIKAAGVGITLTNTARAVFLEESFVPSDNLQAQDRHNRIGQVWPLQVDRLILEGSVDEAVSRITERRTEQWNTLQEEA